ncbi:MAG: hypothetical protein M3N53_06730 [Actinomycetota bacterium]|nr:hypothetical protein [Actinomycetota bacterium]
MRTRSRYLFALAALLLLAACSDGGEATAPPEPAPASLTGLISSIEPAEGPIESFELVAPGEEARRILIDPERDYGFDLQHLHEHMDGEDPVKVALEEREGGLYATAIEDV